MTDFVVSITDPEQLAGITWAREQYNATLPPAAPPPEPLPGHAPMPAPKPAPELDAPALRSAPSPMETDAEYVQWVMEQAAISYAVQQEQTAWRQAYENAQAAARQTARRNMDGENNGDDNS